jgi:hypothetical protein
MNQTRAFFIAAAFTSALGLAGRLGAQSPVTDAVIDACMQPSAAQVPNWQAQGLTTDQIRKTLETALVHCREPRTPGPLANFVAGVNTDLARAALQFLDGKLSYQSYMALMADRNRKFARSQTDSIFRAALASGDADGDLIPDALDGCQNTPDLTPTDDRGCPTPAPACHGPQTTCYAGDDVQRAIGNLKLMYNKSCDDAPAPTTPSPLDWGRGFTGAPPSFGFNLLITRVNNEPPGCEVFYEVEFRFTNGPTGSPQPIYVTAIFSERESLTNDPHSVMLPLPVTKPLAGARARLAGGLSSYLGVSWRVRAVNGSNHYSLWSAIHVQYADPKGVGL